MDIKIIGSGSSGNCYRVSDGTTSILLDAGLPFKVIQKELNFKTSELAGVLITHEHGDHIKAAPDLIKRGIDDWMTPGTRKAAKLKGSHAKELLPEAATWVGSWRVAAVPAIHDAAEPISYYICSKKTLESVVYITDTQFSPYRFGSPTYIMVEANYSAEVIKQRVKAGHMRQDLALRIMENHMSIETAIGLAMANKSSELQGIYLLHLSDANSDAQSFRRRMQEATGVPVWIA